MKVVAILQARCSSSRLPRKVMKKIFDKPMIQHQIERVYQSKCIDKLVLATTDHSSDLPLVELCENINCEYFRGSLDNVLERFYRAALKFEADVVVRLTGDCPLIDWKIIDTVIDKHLSERNDYTSNTTPETFPDGLDVEVMSFDALSEAFENASLQSELEHVTPYIRNRNEFKKGVLLSKVDRSNMRWTVDEDKDFEFVVSVYENLWKNKKYFDSDDVIKLLSEKPELSEVNCKITRNEGYLRSLLEDSDESI